jgi:segregation and condensation protein B
MTDEPDVPPPSVPGPEPTVPSVPAPPASGIEAPGVAVPEATDAVVPDPGSAAPDLVGSGAAVGAQHAAAPTTEPAAKSSPLREPDEDALRLAEALVFASAEPVTSRGLARVLPDDLDADAVLDALRVRYEGRGVELVQAGAGVMFRTALDLAPRLRKVIEAPRRLPRVAMETLAIIAYHQPMTRPEIEHIRGTTLSQQTLDSLLELNLIAPKGRRETPGRPTLWGTTSEFLTHIGLKDIRELPRREDLLLEPVQPRSTPKAVAPGSEPPPKADEEPPTAV